MAEKNLVIWAQEAVLPKGENDPFGYLPLMNSGFSAANRRRYLWTFDGLIAQGYTPKQMATAMSNGLDGTKSP